MNNKESKQAQTAQENKQDANRHNSAQQDNQGTQIPARIVAPVGDGIAYDFPLEPPAHKE